MQNFSNFGQDGQQLLSTKEMDIIRFLSRGLTSKEIAKETDKSHKTIENQLHNILMKLRHQGIRRRLDLVRWALYLNI